MACYNLLIIIFGEFKMRSLTRLLILVVAIFVSLEGKTFDEIPDYFGTPSFRLSDDLDLRSLSKSVADAKAEFDRTQQEDAQQAFRVALSDFEKYKNKIITEIKKINKEGSGAGQSDGRMDGAELAINRSIQGQPIDYPKNFNGPNYKPKINHQLPIMIKAFADGYNYNYRLFARLEFLKGL